MVAGLISIIIPVYNVESYLSKCIDSIVSQTYRDLEIILIDDGSTDGSGSICSRYAAADERIVVIRQDNGGVTKARKMGVCSATGEYIGFVDADDWIESRMYERMISVMKEKDVDVVCTGYYREVENNFAIVYERMPEGYYDMQDEALYKKGLVIDEESGEQNINVYLWCKLFKKEMLADIMERLEDKICYGEDSAAIYAILPKSKSIYVLHEAYYHYGTNPESIVNSRNEHMLESINLVYLFLDSEYKNHKFENHLVRQRDFIMLDMLLKGINSSFFSYDNIQIPAYVLPDFKINKDMRIVVYGAGKVGRCYYQQLKGKGYEDVCLLDKNASEKGLAKGVVHYPQMLKTAEFDMIIIGVRFKGIAEGIKREIMELYGVPEEKILWDEPKLLFQSCMVQK